MKRAALSIARANRMNGIPRSERVGSQKNDDLRRCADAQAEAQDCTERRTDAWRPAKGEDAAQQKGSDWAARPDTAQWLLAELRLAGREGPD